MTWVGQEPSKIAARISALRSPSPALLAIDLASRVAGLLRASRDAYRVARQRARDRAMIDGMDDRGLADLGLTRSEIGSALMDLSSERIRPRRKS